MMSPNSQLREHLPLQPRCWTGESRGSRQGWDSISICFPAHLFPLFGRKEMVPHRRNGDCVLLIAWNTFVSLAHPCSCKGTAVTSPASSFQHLWTRMVTFWEEICINKVVSVSGEWGVACKVRSNFYLKHNSWLLIMLSKMFTTCIFVFPNEFIIMLG